MMKYLTYIFRNARRNPIRTLLTVASTAICLFLMMILLAFFAMRDDAARSNVVFNRIICMNRNGFAGMVPIGRVPEIAQLDGVLAVSPFSWYGGKYHDQQLPFAQFAVDAGTVFKVLNEFHVPEKQLADFQASQDGAAIGRRLASDWDLKVGDSLPLKGDIYPVDMDLTIKAIYDGPSNRNLRMCLFHYEYFDESLKRVTMSAASGGSLATNSSRTSGNAGMVFIKCKNADVMPAVSQKIDDLYHNSEFPTRTQTEEAFGKMFADMMGDLQNAIYGIGVAIVVALLFVAGNAMAMAMRERTSEVAILKAIGFSRAKVLFLVLTEAVLVASVGGALGTLGCKALCDLVDVARYTNGFLPVFFVPWRVASLGLAVSVLVGLVSGVVPALTAANSSVINGLRKVV